MSFSHSVARLFETPWTAAHQVSLSFTMSWSLLKLVSIELAMPANRFSHLILCCFLHYTCHKCHNEYLCEIYRDEKGHD